MTVLNADQSREYDRDLQLLNVLNSNKSVYARFAPFQTHALLFTDNFTLFCTYLPKKEENGSGIVVNKDTLKQTIANDTAALCTNVTSYANSIGNADLATAVRFRASDIKKLKNSEVVGVIAAIAARVTPLIGQPDFVPYNVTTDMLDSLQQQADTYNTLVASAGTADKASSIANDNINKIIRIIRANIREMSLLIHNFESTDPGFVNAYYKAIAVDNSNIHHSGIRGIIKNSSTGQPVYEAVITGEGKNKVVKSAKDGTYSLIKIRPGLRTFTFEAPGYEKQQLTLRVISGKIEEVNIELAAHIIAMSATA